ncbi:lymphocyte antigen 6 family member pge [Leuresthes tenuis]|uniref:lymphocyte antigen 6 family member pge n=1 Tax=Leuresthes tenuis TaxID=355514 RepID=UPI003B5034FF
MRAVQYSLLLLLFVVFMASNSEALKCYTCMGSNNDDCNRQGSKSCPSYSDACAVVVGHDSGVMKSCSYKSFCSQANSQGYRAPGVKVHCCYSDGCNVTSFASRLPGLNYLLLFLLLLLH